MATKWIRTSLRLRGELMEVLDGYCREHDYGWSKLFIEAMSALGIAIPEHTPRDRALGTKRREYEIGKIYILVVPMPVSLRVSCERRLKEQGSSSSLRGLFYEGLQKMGAVRLEQLPEVRSVRFSFIE